MTATRQSMMTRTQLIEQCDASTNLINALYRKIGLQSQRICQLEVDVTHLETALRVAEMHLNPPLTITPTRTLVEETGAYDKILAPARTRL
ncbi:MAG: hypothetical protein GY851_00460 [bacterium]|nr:hypothetical protein [bacterium]